MPFIKVFFGENEEQFFNPECKIKNLLEDIRVRCACGESDVLDLSDTKGNLQNLAELEPFQFSHASLFLSQNDRGEYILLKIRYDEMGRIQHIPLLKKACITYPLILDHLEVPSWVEGAGQKSSTRKLNRLRLATRLTMAAAHDRKHRTGSSNRHRCGSSGSGDSTGKKGGQRPPVLATQRTPSLHQYSVRSIDENQRSPGPQEELSGGTPTPRGVASSQAPARTPVLGTARKTPGSSKRTVRSAKHK